MSRLKCGYGVAVEVGQIGFSAFILVNIKGSCRPDFDLVEIRSLIRGCHESTGSGRTRVPDLLLLIARCGIGWRRDLAINYPLIVRLMLYACARERGRPVVGLRLAGGGGWR